MPCLREEQRGRCACQFLYRPTNVGGSFHLRPPLVSAGGCSCCAVRTICCLPLATAVVWHCATFLAAGARYLVTGSPLSPCWRWSFSRRWCWRAAPSASSEGCWFAGRTRLLTSSAARSCCWLWRCGVFRRPAAATITGAGAVFAVLFVARRLRVTRCPTLIAPRRLLGHPREPRGNGRSSLDSGWWAHGLAELGEKCALVFCSYGAARVLPVI